jgi:LPS O-antigen subunit length determinant protein (WzzB/FepE family)
MLVSDLEFVAQRLAKQTVDERWKETGEIPPPSTALAATVFVERFTEESGLEADLITRLWADKERGVYLAAKVAYEQRLTDLKSENQAQFLVFWTSRVSSKARLHSLGLTALEDGSLKEQLKELLALYLAKDLIPATIKRARTKGLVHTQLTQKSISKLEEALADDKKDKISPLDALMKFNKKLGIETPTSEELNVVKKDYLQEIVQSVEKDVDGPRLFLGAVVNLFAMKHDGVLYASGKFAPRLLKLLKADLETTQFKRLEELKEAVKAGSVNDEMRHEMRAMAKGAIEA